MARQQGREEKVMRRFATGARVHGFAAKGSGLSCKTSTLPKKSRVVKSAKQNVVD